VEKAVTSDRRFGPRDYWWMILLYFAGSIIMGVVVGLTAVGVA
jgi:uncharacterized membrane protein YhaH (DUF805 family)